MSNFPDDLDANQRKIMELLKGKQILIGLPTMKLIGRFEFDWNSNILRIPPRQESVGINPTSNLMFIKKQPYLNMKIDDIGEISIRMRRNEATK